MLCGTCCTEAEVRGEVVQVDARPALGTDPELQSAPSQPPASTAPAPGEVFHIRLERTSAKYQGLGIYVNHDDASSLFVEIVSTVADTLVPIWNKVNSDLQVRVGDRVLEVNGVRGCAQMINECTSAEVKVLEMTLIRGAGRLPLKGNDSKK